MARLEAALEKALAEEGINFSQEITAEDILQRRDIEDLISLELGKPTSDEYRTLMEMVNSPDYNKNEKKKISEQLHHVMDNITETQRVWPEWYDLTPDRSRKAGEGRFRIAYAEDENRGEYVDIEYASWKDSTVLGLMPKAFNILDRTVNKFSSRVINRHRPEKLSRISLNEGRAHCYNFHIYNNYSARIARRLALNDLSTIIDFGEIEYPSMFSSLKHRAKTGRMKRIIDAHNKGDYDQLDGLFEEAFPERQYTTYNELAQGVVQILKL